MSEIFTHKRSKWAYGLRNSGKKKKLQLCAAEEMEPPATAAKRSSRQLIFDRRYGWVVDEWKDPSEEALAGGRGMFCIVPLAKTLFQTSSQSVNSAVKVLDRACSFPSQVLQTNVDNELQKWASLVRKPESSVQTEIKE